MWVCSGSGIDHRGSVVLRYRTGDIIEGGLVYTPCPYCGRVLPRLVGKISRNSEIKSMQLDKIKGTLVDFNQLEHVLDDAPNVGAWQIEIRKFNDDPMELDELILHVHGVNDVAEEKLARELNSRFLERTEIRPNQIVFHGIEELRALLGVGTQLKEQKVIDRRPKRAAPGNTPAPLPCPAAGPGSLDGADAATTITASLAAAAAEIEAKS